MSPNSEKPSPNSTTQNWTTSPLHPNRTFEKPSTTQATLPSTKKPEKERNLQLPKPPLVTKTTKRWKHLSLLQQEDSRALRKKLRRPILIRHRQRGIIGVGRRLWINRRGCSRRWQREIGMQRRKDAVSHKNYQTQNKKSN